MRAFLKWVGRILAGLFALLFVISAVTSLILMNLGNRLFSPAVYKNALADLNVYETMPELVGRLLASGMSYNPCQENPVTCEEISPGLRLCYQEAFGMERYLALAGGEEEPTEREKGAVQACLDQYGGTPAPVESSSEGGMPEYFQNLDEEDWASILRTVLPKDEMKRMAEAVIDDTFAYLSGDLDQVTVSLIPLKQRLSGPAGDDLILQILTSQPPCTEEELAAVRDGTLGEGMVMCNPPEDMLSSVFDAARQQLDEAVAGLSDSAVVIKPYTPGSTGQGPLGSDPLTGIRNLRFILRLSPLLPLFFLLLVTIFAVRSLKDWMRWWGIPFFLAGGSALFAGASSARLLSRVWETFVAPNIPPFLAESAGTLLRDFVTYIAHDLTERIVLQALLLLVLGLAAWIVSYFIKAKARAEEPPLPVPPAS